VAVLTTVGAIGMRWFLLIGCTAPPEPRVEAAIHVTVSDAPRPPWALAPPDAPDGPGAAWWTARACTGDPVALDAVAEGSADCPFVSHPRCAALTREMQTAPTADRWATLARCTDPSLAPWFARADAPDAAVARWHGGGQAWNPRLLTAIDALIAAPPETRDTEALLAGLDALAQVDQPAVAAAVARWWASADEVRPWLAHVAVAQSSGIRSALLAEVCAIEDCSPEALAEARRAAHPLEALDEVVGDPSVDLDALARRLPDLREPLDDALAACAAEVSFPCLRALAARDRTRAASVAAGFQVDPAEDPTGLLAPLAQAPDPAPWAALLATHGIAAVPGTATAVEALVTAGRAVPARYDDPSAMASLRLLTEIAAQVGWTEPAFATVAAAPREAPFVPRETHYGWAGGRRYRVAAEPWIAPAAAAALWGRMAEDAGRPERARLTADGAWVVIGTDAALDRLADDGLVQWLSPFGDPLP
jgi:hypothetical protein